MLQNSVALATNDRLMCYNIYMRQKRQILTYPMLERIIFIHKKILSCCYPNTNQLAYDLETSLATISRDVEFLRDRFGAPIEYDARRRGYYYTDEYDMPLNNISISDFQALSSAKTLLAHYKDTPLYDEVNRVLDFLCDTRGYGSSGFMERIATPPSPRIVIDEKIWNEVCKAMHENRVIEFDYNGRWNTETTHRSVHPYQLLLDDGMCFVFGYAEERKAERLFSISRMKNLTVTNRKFELPADYQFETRCGGGKFGSFISETAENYKIEFYGDSRQYVRDCIWADDQKIKEDEKKGVTTIKFSSTQFLKIREWVLAQGANAKPLKPEWFVNDWKAQVKAMAKLAK